MEYRDEQVIAKKAEQMLTSALQRKTKSSFKDHYHNSSDKLSLKDAYGKAKLSEYGLVKNGTKQFYIRNITIQMARHGFIQHYGVDTIRAGGKRERHLPKSISYEYKEHPFNMKETPFLGDVIRSSGVIDYVSKNIARLRGEKLAEEVVFHLSIFSKD